jgi:hypothetical protein
MLKLMHVSTDEFERLVKSVGFFIRTLVKKTSMPTVRYIFYRRFWLWNASKIK